MRSFKLKNLKELAKTNSNAKRVLDEYNGLRDENIDEVKKSTAKTIVASLFLLNRNDLKAIKEYLRSDAEMYNGLGMTRYVNDWFVYYLARSKKPNTV